MEKGEQHFAAGEERKKGCGAANHGRKMNF